MQYVYKYSIFFKYTFTKLALARGSLCVSELLIHSPAQFKSQICALILYDLVQLNLYCCGQATVSVLRMVGVVVEMMMRRRHTRRITAHIDDGLRTRCRRRRRRRRGFNIDNDLTRRNQMTVFQLQTRWLRLRMMMVIEIGRLCGNQLICRLNI